MDKKIDFDKKYFQNKTKKRQIVLKHINNYINQLKIHFELTNNEVFELLTMVNTEYKKVISYKKWWIFFK